MADFATRSLGIGYFGGSLILFACLMASLGAWYWRAGSIAVDTVVSPRIGSVLLDGDPVLANPGHRAWRLDG